MDVFHNLAVGFAAAGSPQNLLFCFVGCLLGTLIGVLPGIGPVATIAMLLPVTYGLSPLAALIMLAGIYYGAQYGGSTTAILVNIPGEVAEGSGIAGTLAAPAIPLPPNRRTTASQRRSRRSLQKIV